jgi:hypothetical protein
MAYDIQAAISGDPVKNGTLVTTTTFTGYYSKSDLYVKNSPTISDLQNKYDERFYNGIFVNIVADQTVIGG